MSKNMGWQIPEYEERLVAIKEIRNLVENPEVHRLLTEHNFWKDLLNEMCNPKTEAYKFLKFYAGSDENIQFVKGESTGQYAIFLGERSEAGYPRLLFFDDEKPPVHLPRLLVTSGEKFEEIPVRDFVLAVMELF